MRFKLYSLVLFFVSFHLSMTFQLTYNPVYDPFKTLANEANKLKQYVDIYILSDYEQKLITGLKPNTGSVIVGKLVTDSVNFTSELLNSSSAEYWNLTESVTLGIEEFTTRLNSSEILEHKILQISEFSNLGLPLIFFCLQSKGGNFNNEEVKNSSTDYIPDQLFGDLNIRNFTLAVYKSVQPQTVYEFTVQLYLEPFQYGMQDPSSEPYLNMTDQMLHLIGPKFENTFGDSYYRVVVEDFYPSRKTLIVRTAVLLDPSDENYYYAHRTWYNLEGFVILGKYPVMPDNVYLTETHWILADFYPFLSDRSYKYPMNNQADSGYLSDITLPVAMVMVALVIILILLMRLCSWLASNGSEDDQENDEEPNFKKVGRA